MTRHVGLLLTLLQLHATTLVHALPQHQRSDNSHHRVLDEIRQHPNDNVLVAIVHDVSASALPPYAVDYTSSSAVLLQSAIPSDSLAASAAAASSVISSESIPSASSSVLVIPSSSPSPISFSSSMIAQSQTSTSIQSPLPQTTRAFSSFAPVATPSPLPSATSTSTTEEPSIPAIQFTTSSTQQTFVQAASTIAEQPSPSTIETSSSSSDDLALSSQATVSAVPPVATTSSAQNVVPDTSLAVETSSSSSTSSAPTSILISSSIPTPSSSWIAPSTTSTTSSSSSVSIATSSSATISETQAFSADDQSTTRGTSSSTARFQPQVQSKKITSTSQPLSTESSTTHHRHHSETSVSSSSLATLPSTPSTRRSSKEITSTSTSEISTTRRHHHTRSTFLVSNSSTTSHTTSRSEVIITSTVVIDSTKTLTTCWTSYRDSTTPTPTPTSSLIPTRYSTESYSVSKETTESRQGAPHYSPSVLTSSIVRITTMISTFLDRTVTTTVTTTDFITRTIFPTPDSNTPSSPPARATPKSSIFSMTTMSTAAIISMVDPTSSPVSTLSSATLTQGSTESPVTVTVSLVTTLTTSEVQTIFVTEVPETSGSLHTSLATAGNPSTQPFNTTVIPTPSSRISAITTGTAVISTSSIVMTSAPAHDIFSAVDAGGPPPPQISTRSDYPVPTLGINKTAPIETNKFYANLFLDTRTAPAYTFPYSVSWIGGQGVSSSWGFGISQTTGAQRVDGPGNPVQYYINPVGLESVIISALELGSSTSMTMSDIYGFSAQTNLAPSEGAEVMLSFPLVQGMAFLTGVFTNGTPLLQSTIFFSTLQYGGMVAGGNTARYTVSLMDKTTWFIYMTADPGSSLPTLTLAGDSQIVGNKVFSGTVQVAKAPGLVSMQRAQSLYDLTAGVYPLTANITASVQGTAGSYTIGWPKAGLTNKRLVMWALPHHISSISAATAGAVQRDVLIQTTTKGLATAIYADSWTLVESLPTSMGFAPWSPTLGSVTKLPAAAQSLIAQVAAVELAENMEAQTDLNSMYFAGKAFAKFAAIVYAANNLGGATGVASAGLVELKAQFSRFVNNTQIYPLVYDDVFGGAVSSASYITGDPGIDFGNTYYNDHHFHYGYFVYTAAVIGYLDPEWLRQGTNKAWVDMLIRDYANPVMDDAYFPFSRMFDWYHGHSWAAGLFESFDGKNQESSSEDTFSLYAIKMWGRTVGDSNMEARGNLMLAVQARALSDVYLLQDDNVVEPANFIGNKASGILFENKIDHTTYFGTETAYIEGIHMLPLSAPSALTRKQPFVSQEWSTYFSNGRVDTVVGGWRGILYANLALIDPVTAYNWFADPSFDSQYLDGGASRTWYLAFCAGLGGLSS